MSEYTEKLELASGIWNEETLEFTNDLAVRTLVSRGMEPLMVGLVVSRLDRAVSVPLALGKGLPAWYTFVLDYNELGVRVSSSIVFTGRLPLNVRDLVAGFINENTRD